MHNNCAFFILQRRSHHHYKIKIFLILWVLLGSYKLIFSSILMLNNQFIMQKKVPILLSIPFLFK
nr:MAG TPA: hypothetical protein [Caudoviricetes sp.]